MKDYLIPRWREEVAEEIEPVEVEEWLTALHDEEELEWTTLSKFRQVMSHVYTNGQKYGLIPRGQGVNPMEFVTCESSSNYEAMTLSPEQTVAVLSYLGEAEKTLTFMIAVVIGKCRNKGDYRLNLNGGGKRIVLSEGKEW